VRAGGPGGAPGRARVYLLGPADGHLAYDALVALRVLPPDARPETPGGLGPGQAGRDGRGLDELTASTRTTCGRSSTRARGGHPRQGPQGRSSSSRHPERDDPAQRRQGGAMFEVRMTHPRGSRRWSSPRYWYPDIYPHARLQHAARATSTAQQMRYATTSRASRSARSLASPLRGVHPVVFGEFGTYWKLRRHREDWQTPTRPAPTSLIDYYEAFDRLFRAKTSCGATRTRQLPPARRRLEPRGLLLPRPAHAPRGELSLEPAPRQGRGGA
jgi:hypothetical protein